MTFSTPFLKQPEELQLSNGIPVILQDYDGAVAALYWWVNVGSSDELSTQSGFAHFLEHMLFKDASAKETGNASTGKMALAIESLGGDVNAYTSFDQTVYHVSCAAQHWEKIIPVFSEVARPQHFLEEDFCREREVILEELRKNNDSPGRQLFQSLFSVTFKKHPYGRSIIGSEKTLKSASLKELELFYRRHYVASQMGLILVGPLDTGPQRKRTILNLLEKSFGKNVLPNKKVSHKHQVLKRLKEPSLQSSANWITRSFDVQSPSVAFSFRVPDLFHPDVPALELLLGILGSGELSRMYQRLFYECSLVTDISAGFHIPKDPGMLYFHADIDSVEKINPVVSEMVKQLLRICNEGPTFEEIQRVLVNIESERLYATQTVDSLAGRLGFLKFIVGNLQFDLEYVDRLKKIQPIHIQEVAKKYFDYRRMSGVVFLPKTEHSFDLQEIKELVSGTLTSALTLLPLEQSKGNLRTSSGSFDFQVELIQHSSGLRTCYLSRPQSDVFSICASVLGGVRLESIWGSSHLASLVWTKSTQHKTTQEVFSIVEGRAAHLEGFSGKNSIGIQMTGLVRDWEVLSKLFLEVLTQPAFLKEEVEHAKRITEESIRGLEDHSSQLCSQLFLESLFQSHPYGRFPYGDLNSLSQLDSAQLSLLHQGWVRPERLVLSASGALSQSVFQEWTDRCVQQLSLLSHGSPLGDPILLDEPELKAHRWVEKTLQRGQCHILVGGLGIQMTSQDRYVLRLLQTLLGGQSGRLFTELREKKSLAYSVSPLSFEGLEKGYLGTYLACAPNKRDEALGEIQKVFEKLSKKGPTTQEMKRAQELYLGRRAMDLQGDSTLSAHFGLETVYNLNFLKESEIRREIKSISSKEIQSVCRRYFLDAHLVTCVVG